MMLWGELWTQLNLPHVQRPFTPGRTEEMVAHFLQPQHHTKWSVKHVSDLALKNATHSFELGQKKLDKVITPEVWKEDPTSKASGRKLNENKLLSKNKK